MRTEAFYRALDLSAPYQSKQLAVSMPRLFYLRRKILGACIQSRLGLTPRTVVVQIPTIAFWPLEALAEMFDERLP